MGKGRLKLVAWDMPEERKSVVLICQKKGGISLNRKNSWRLRGSLEKLPAGNTGSHWSKLIWAAGATDGGKRSSHPHRKRLLPWTGGGYGGGEGEIGSQK